MLGDEGRKRDLAFEAPKAWTDFLPDEGLCSTVAGEKFGEPGLEIRLAGVLFGFGRSIDVDLVRTGMV